MLLKSPSFEPSELNRLDSINFSEWARYALAWYSLAYTFHEKDERECEWLRVVWEELHRLLPLKYRVGVYLLGQGRAHCGEDVYLVDGIVLHALWKFHSKCGASALLWRELEEERQCLWCATCDCEVLKDEVEELSVH